MKKLALLLFAGLTLSLANGQTTRYDTIRYARRHYAKRVALFKTEPVQKGVVVMLGNSITEFADWRKLLHDSTVVNRGIAADNTFGVIDRLDDVVRRQPSKLFIEVGINDLAQNIPHEIILKNMLTIVHLVHSQSPQTRIYVTGILPANDRVRNEYPEVYGKNRQANAINREISRNAKKNKFTFIDLYPLLKDESGNLDEKFSKSDGLHLNETGYQAWIGLLKQMNILK